MNRLLENEYKRIDLDEHGPENSAYWQHHTDKLHQLGDKLSWQKKIAGQKKRCRVKAKMTKIIRLRLQDQTWVKKKSQTNATKGKHRLTLSQTPPYTRNPLSAYNFNDSEPKEILEEIAEELENELHQIYGQAFQFSLTRNWNILDNYHWKLCLVW